MRTGLHITEHDFPEIYTWLEFFAQNYDNAAKEVQIVLHGIVEAYMEKRADEHRVITEEEAIAFLKARDSNPRNAGLSHNEVRRYSGASGNSVCRHLL